jgi:hypothetical protein
MSRKLANRFFEWLSLQIDCAKERRAREAERCEELFQNAVAVGKRQHDREIQQIADEVRKRLV